jgi:O-antigen ligase
MRVPDQHAISSQYSQSPAQSPMPSTAHALTRQHPHHSVKDAPSRYFLLLLWAGCLLMPFSTGIDASVGVQAFGIPVLAIAALTGGIAAIGNVSIGLPPRVALFLWTCALSVAWLTICATWSPQPLPSLSRAFVNVLGLALLMCCVLIVARHWSSLSWRSIGLPVVAASTLLSAYYVVNLAWVIHLFGTEAVVLERYVGGLMSLPWGASNTIAAVLLLGLGMAFLLRERMSSLWLWGIALVHVTAIALTFSRNGAAMAILLLLLGANRVERRFLLIGIGALLFTALAEQQFVAESAALTELIENRLTGGDEVSNGRLEIWSNKVEYFLNNPWLPTGYYSLLYKFDFSGHNFAITTLIEQGFPGLLLNLALLWQLFAMPAKSGTSRTPMTFQRLWFLVTVNMTFEDPHFTQPFIILFWLVATTHLLCHMEGQKMRTHAAPARI